MQRILLLLVFTVALLAGCQKKDDYLLGKTPDERLVEALKQYQDVLTGAPYGWKVIEYPQGLVSTYNAVSVFSYYMKFKDSSFVTMYSDFDTLTASVPKTSGYRLKALQRPSIEFDTYGYIHLPCDPDPVISKSPVASQGGGYGWGADFDFSFPCPRFAIAAFVLDSHKSHHGLLSPRNDNFLAPASLFDKPGELRLRFVNSDSFHGWNLLS